MKIGQMRLQFHKRAKLPLILQDEIAECGHACIAMITGYWGAKFSLSTLRSLYHPSTRGMTLAQMNQIFDQLGFKTRVLRVVMSDLHKIKTPAIIHWNKNHFVVLKKVKSRSVVIHDPAVGIQTFSKKELSHYFAGIVLEVESSQYLDQNTHSDRLTIGRLLKSMRNMPKIFAMLLGLSGIIELLQLINPLFMQYATDYVVGSNALSQMYKIAFGCVLFTILQGVIEWLRGHLIVYTSMQITESFASEVFKHLLRLPLKFFTHRHLSDIHAKFQSIDQLKLKLSTDFLHSCLDGVMMIIILMLMFFYSPILASVIVTVLSLYAMFLFWNMRHYQMQTSAALMLHAKSAVTFYEIFRGIASIKSFLKETLWFQLWRNDYVDALNRDIQISALHIRFRIVNQMLFQIEYVAIICIGAGFIVTQRLTIGMLLAFLAYRMILANKFATLVQTWFSYQSLNLQLQRLEDVIEQEPEVIAHAMPPADGLEAMLKIENMTFSYPGSQQTLFKDLTFTIKPGERIVITGPSGCGKTTLLKIMMGFEQPNSGVILIDDLPLTQFGLQHFRHLSASVMQEDVLFTGSIVDNITFFSEQIDLKIVYEVSKLMCIHDTILSLPLGYETVISQTHSTLSAGQKQRILLARALYRKPKFLFLDEATGHLDLELEEKINQALGQCTMTKIIVTHRPAIIAMADRVINLGDEFLAIKCDVPENS